MLETRLRVETPLRDTDDGSALCQTACLCAGAVRALGKALPASHRGRGGCLKRGVCLSERGWDWYVCEGFQHILCQQAEALKALGVGPEFKVSPLCLDVSFPSCSESSKI